MSDFYERHCNDFYLYITRNERNIKHEVMKNITYDEELFEEAYSESIVRVANAILVNHKVIEDFRHYFFISFKQNYIQMQNRKRRHIGATIPIEQTDFSDSDGHEVGGEDRYERIRGLLIWLSDYLEEKFPPNEVDIYIVYYFLKVGKNRVSYRKMAEIYGVDVRYITNVIQNIKRFVRCDETIYKKKKEMLYGDDFAFSS